MLACLHSPPGTLLQVASMEQDRQECLGLLTEAMQSYGRIAAYDWKACFRTGHA